MTEEHHHNTKYHHHHSHHEHIDESELFKRQQLRAHRRKEVFSRLLFHTLCVAAVLIIVAVIWLYTHD